MDLLLHFIEHALEDTLVLVPFLFVTYIALEALEHAAGARANAVVRRAGAAGPVAGALLGVVPQCGFSAMAATLYAGRVVTLGTLVAVFLSTSDEMLPMLVAERVDAVLLFRVLGLKVLVALITGALADLAIRALRKNARVHAFLRRTVLSVRRDGMEADVVDQMAEGGSRPPSIFAVCASRIIAVAATIMYMCMETSTAMSAAMSTAMRMPTVTWRVATMITATTTTTATATATRAGASESSGRS